MAMTEHARATADACYMIDTGAQRFRAHDTADFWPKMMAGEIEGEALVSFFRMESDFPHWEMHPEGDELFVLHSGEIKVVLEQDGAETVFRLKARQTCVIPRGAWHFAYCVAPGDLTVITFGEGTQHRAVDGAPGTAA
ncbi:hypothetical protein CVT23_09795 [Minwuia thermotolerans]|uniref:Cupin domain-containing protein n=2 Tax=Minwuia thermotolerans TaxID=2056226 RepID=A0A2M9G2X6_9PROT|nr:hypothetical protein CVT23_09795 [Minwuia thermotolerans]